MRASEQFKKKNIVTCAYSYHFGFGFIVLTFYLNPFWLKMKLRYPIRHIQLMLQGIKPKPGDISQKKEEKGATPRLKSK